MVWLGGAPVSPPQEEERQEAAQRGDAAVEAAQGPTPCPKCNQLMREGFAVDHSSNGAQTGTWVEGRIEYGWFGLLKLGSRRTLIIRGYRCTSCGYLELYAS